MSKRCAFYLCKNCAKKKPFASGGSIGTMEAKGVTTKLTKNRQTTAASGMKNNSNLFQFGFKNPCKEKIKERMQEDQQLTTP
jgi:hypothetical protein